MREEPRQGTLANSSGNTLEKTVIGTLTSKGFEVMYYREFVKNPQKYGTELLLRNVPFDTIYGHRGNTEFLLRSKKYQLEIRIECKWQQVSGSVDEKFPYLYLNCIDAMPEQHIIIIVDGGGAKKGAIDWLKQAADEGKYASKDSRKKVQVMSLTDFLIWSNNTLR